MNITKTGIMAYVEIPKLNIYMPVYHGTDEGVLQIAAGHLPGQFPACRRRNTIVLYPDIGDCLLRNYLRILIS